MKLFLSPLLFISASLSISAMAEEIISWPQAENTEYQIQNPGTFFNNDPQKNQWFGSSLDYFGQNLVVSATGSWNSYKGEVYLFKGDDGRFDKHNFEKLVEPIATTSSKFGASIAHLNNTLFISAPSATVNSQNYIGAVYQIIDKDEDHNFSDEQITKIVNTKYYAQLTNFGKSIAASNHTLAIGAPDGLYPGLTGAVNLIHDDELDNDFSNNTQQRITPVNGVLNEKFGQSVSIDGNVLVVGAPGKSSSPANYDGKIYIIVDKDNDGDFLEEEQQIINSPITGMYDQFGYSVSVSGNKILVGAYQFNRDERTIGFAITDTDNDNDFTDEQVVNLGTERTLSGTKVNIYNDVLFVNAYEKLYLYQDINGDGIYQENESSTITSSKQSFGEDHLSTSNQVIASNPYDDYTPKGVIQNAGSISIFDKVSSLSLALDENISHVITLKAQSSTNQAISYSIEPSRRYGEGIDNDLFSINETTGELKFNNAPNYEQDLGYYSDGKYRVFVKAKTNDSYGLLKLEITVKDVNEAPRLEKALNSQEAKEDEQFQFAIPTGTFVDEDANDQLNYKANLANTEELPTWLHFDKETLSFNGLASNEDVGVYKIIITAIDSQGINVSSSFDLSVININDAPVAIDDEASTDDITDISIDVLVNDYDIDANDVISIKTAQAEQGNVSIENNKIVYSPKLGFEGTDVIVYTIEDKAAEQGTAQVVVTITKNPVPEEPIENNTKKQTSSSGGSFSFLLLVLTIVCRQKRRLLITDKFSN